MVARAAHVTELSLVPNIRTYPIGDGDVTAIGAVATALADIVTRHGSLYQWASALPQPRALRGRAPVYVAQLPATSDTVVIRHAWHGGLLAPLTGDRFRMPTRAPRELARSYALRVQGIPTSEVLGFARYSAGFGCRTVDVVSRFIPDAADLGIVAAGLAPEIDLAAALDSTIALLATLAAHGVIHPDLNVKNVLLRRTPTQSLEAMMIDVDVVQWDHARSPRAVMQANVARLTRSMRKWRSHFGCSVSDEQLAAFEQRAFDAMLAAPAPPDTPARSR